jgi:hypothetical protein
MEVVSEAKKKVAVIGKTDSEKYKMVEFLSNFLPDMQTRIPTYINQGGCGIFAKHVYLNLTKMGYDVKIGFVGRNGDKKPLNDLTNNNTVSKKRFGVVHTVIQFSDYLFFDSDGITRTPTDIARQSRKKYFYGTISLESLEILIKNKYSWNDMFDRDCEGKIIDELGQMSEKFELFKEGKLEFKPQLKIRLTDYSINIKKKERSFDLLSSLVGDDDDNGSDGGLGSFGNMLKAGLLSHIKTKLKKDGRDISDVKGIQVIRVPKKDTTKVTTEKK